MKSLPQTDLNPLSRQHLILQAIEIAGGKLSVAELFANGNREGWYRDAGGRRKIKSALKALIDDGCLAYSDRFGRTFIEISFARPVHVTDRVVIKPPLISYRPGPQEVVVVLGDGAAFGGGQHPTTRMAIAAIQHLLTGHPRLGRSQMLDLGTGNGVLALVGLRFGIARALGVDIDPCALYEAGQNAGLNDLQTRFETATEPPDALSGRSDLVAANLRTPTLIQMLPQIRSLTKPGGGLVLSGLKTRERATVEAAYVAAGVRPVWADDQNDWAALALRKR